MNAAGLTHAGFYGYFKSKDDLIAQAVREALSRALAVTLRDCRRFVEIST